MQPYKEFNTNSRLRNISEIFCIGNELNILVFINKGLKLGKKLTY